MNVHRDIRGGFVFRGANCIGLQKLMKYWFVWKNTGHHPPVDFIPLSSGVLRTSLIGWRLKSSRCISGLNQSPIETCHLKLIDTITVSRPTLGLPLLYMYSISPAAYGRSPPPRWRKFNSCYWDEKIKLDDLPKGVWGRGGAAIFIFFTGNTWAHFSTSFDLR